jgi:hypothetical protein
MADTRRFKERVSLVEIRDLLSQSLSVGRSYGNQHIRYPSRLELTSEEDHDDLPDGTRQNMACVRGGVFRKGARVAAALASLSD